MTKPRPAAWPVAQPARAEVTRVNPLAPNLDYALALGWEVRHLELAHSRPARLIGRRQQWQRSTTSLRRRRKCTGRSPKLQPLTRPPRKSSGGQSLLIWKRMIATIRTSLFICANESQ